MVLLLLRNALGHIVVAYLEIPDTYQEIPDT